jgi:hypothetical protein
MATAGDVAAPSQMEQSVDMGGGLSQLVRCSDDSRASERSALSWQSGSMTSESRVSCPLREG